MKKLSKQELDTKQKIEINFWQNSTHENPFLDSIHNIINKISDSEVFLNCLNQYQKKLSKSGRVLELGGGQGWASCIYKKTFPEAHVTSTDISEFATASLPKWERIFDVKLDNSYSCRSYEIPEPSETIDIIFCFSAAHHFLADRTTLTEIKRVLKPKGLCFYFYEPSAPEFFYPIALWRVNKKRPEVPEDVLIIKRLKKIAMDLNLGIEVNFYPSTLKRGTIEIIYYSLLKICPWLQRFFLITVNIIFNKK